MASLSSEPGLVWERPRTTILARSGPSRRSIVAGDIATSSPAIARLAPRSTAKSGMIGTIAPMPTSNTSAGAYTPRATALKGERLGGAGNFVIPPILPHPSAPHFPRPAR